MIGSFFLGFNQTNLGQRTGERGWPLYIGGQWLGAFRQRRGRVERRQFAPVPRRAWVERRGQFLPERRTKSGFEAVGDGEGVDHRRPAFAVLHRQHLGERQGLGCEAGTG